MLRRKNPVDFPTTKPYTNPLATIMIEILTNKIKFGKNAVLV
jgi:hypothetical protein